MRSLRRASACTGGDAGAARGGAAEHGARAGRGGARAAARATVRCAVPRQSARAAAAACSRSRSASCRRRHGASAAASRTRASCRRARRSRRARAGASRWGCWSARSCARRASRSIARAWSSGWRRRPPSHPDPQEARRQYLASREAMQQLESAALEDQALDWVLSQVKVVDRPSTLSRADRLWPNDLKRKTYTHEQAL